MKDVTVSTTRCLVLDEEIINPEERLAELERRQRERAGEYE